MAINYKNNQRGFGLLEVLAAVVLLVLGVTSILGAFVNATAWNQGAGQRTQAISYASAVIEHFRAQPHLVQPMSETAINELSLDLEMPPQIDVVVAIREYDRILDLYMLVVKVGWSAGEKPGMDSLVVVLPGSRS